MLEVYMRPIVKFILEGAEVVERFHVEYFWNQTCRFFVIQNLSSDMKSYK